MHTAQASLPDFLEHLVTLLIRAKTLAATRPEAKSEANTQDTLPIPLLDVLGYGPDERTPEAGIRSLALTREWVDYFLLADKRRARSYPGQYSKVGAPHARRATRARSRLTQSARGSFAGVGDTQRGGDSISYRASVARRSVTPQAFAHYDAQYFQPSTSLGG